MRVSEHFNLGVDQPSLDFVDVDLETDIRLFVDPTALYLLDTEWGAECRSLIRDYFGLVLQYIRDGEHDKARALLAVLAEPNETHLGLSSDRPRGHGMGKELARKMWQGLKDSLAVSTGLIENLEDTALMIDGIASDVISDIVTNIIREPLLRYTEDMCKNYGIPLVANVASRPLWNPREKKWETRHVEQPIVAGNRLMLVPKALVRKSISYDAGNYYNMYLLERLQEEDVSNGLVRILKNGETRPPTKKSIKERYGEGKEQNRRLTPTREDVLERYRRDKRETPKEALAHSDIAEATHTETPDWDRLLGDITTITPGQEGAHNYERNVQSLFDALFYPWLMYPEPQTRIHEGRKIIDLTYSNMAQDDFFNWLKSHYPSAFVVIEFKNYSVDPGNEALDQLAGRFSPSRGKFGMLVCRNIQDKAAMLARCRDVVHDDRGYIIALDDDDIRELVRAVRFDEPNQKLQLLRTKFTQIIR